MTAVALRGTRITVTDDRKSTAMDDLLDIGPLGSLLRGLADDGFGTVLGARAGRPSGLRRVARAGSPELNDLLDRLYREQYSSLVGYAMRQLPDRPRAEDVVQRAFEKVWKRSPDPAELDNPTAYVVTATRNEINRELRRVVTERSRTADVPDDADGRGGLEAHPSADDGPGRVDDRLALGEALAALPAREREAVVLRVQWQLSVEDAASVMGVSTGAVKGYTHHGLRKLRERVGAA